MAGGPSPVGLPQDVKDRKHWRWWRGVWGEGRGDRLTAKPVKVGVKSFTMVSCRSNLTIVYFSVTKFSSATRSRLNCSSHQKRSSIRVIIHSLH